MNVVENSFMKKTDYIMSEKNMNKRQRAESIRICMNINMMLLLKKMLISTGETLAITFDMQYHQNMPYRNRFHHSVIF